MDSKSNEKGWYLADLHVHTPASKDYKGPKSKEEYKNIIKSANDFLDSNSSAATRINLICITDHNSVDGYESIIEIKKETSSLIRV